MKVLLADNNYDFINTRAEFLEDEGYQVLKALTLEEARRPLTKVYVHPAIPDIRWRMTVTTRMSPA